MPRTTFRLKIEKLVYGGWGLGRHRGKVVFVPFTVPGDRVEVAPVVEKKSYTMGRLVGILAPGRHRQKAHCEHFGSCGGCQWQHLEYPHQVDIKRELFEETITHRFPETRNLLFRLRGSPHVFECRSRARLQVQAIGHALKIGFFRAQTHEVEDVEFCPLLRPCLNNGLLHARRFLFAGKASPLPAEIVLASSEEIARWACAGIELRGQLIPTMKDDPPEFLEGLLRRTVGRFRYWVSPAAFFQANDFMIAELLETVIELASDTRKCTALDLYAGVGLFSLPLAAMFDRVVAVDSSEEAARLCRKNAEVAGMDNIRTICADVPTWAAKSGSRIFDLVILDPPRAGAGKEVMKRIAEWEPEAIIYVSCDPQTMVRDLAALPRRTYRIDRVEGFDLFPQTYHVEVVVRLSRR